jgi:hypothetical protein
MSQSFPICFMPVLPEDFKKLLDKSPDELAAMLNYGERDSAFTFAVKSILDFKLQKGLLIESKKMAAATMIAATVPVLLSLLDHFIR